MRGMKAMRAGEKNNIVILCENPDSHRDCEPLWLDKKIKLLIFRVNVKPQSYTEYYTELRRITL